MLWYIEKYREQVPEKVIDQLLYGGEVVEILVVSDKYGIEPTKVFVRQVGLSIDEDGDIQLVFNFFGDHHDYIAYFTTKGWMASFV
jgi:hypothetical protein